MNCKTWPQKSTERAEFLESIIPENQKEFLDNLVNIAEKLSYPIYIVGGFVRDTILDLPVSDLDIVVEGDASILAEKYIKHYGGKVIHHERFLTTSLILPLNIEKNKFIAYDIASTRSDIYERPGALPTVKRGTIYDDIRRRDFTINAMAICLNHLRYGEFVDELNGMEDLSRGIVRILRHYSFHDDPTRIFRAARYAVRFNFNVEINTVNEIIFSRKILKEISGQRIRHEIDLIMKEEKPSQVLSLLEEWGILENIYPGISSKKSYIHKAKNVRFNQDKEGIINNWTLWLMHLPENINREINMRLHFPKYVLDSILGASKLVRSMDTYLGISPSELVNKLAVFPLSTIYATIHILPDGIIKDSFNEYINTWRHIKPKVTGNTLRNSGIPSGPNYRTILGKIKDALVDGDITTAQDEKDLLGKLISEIQEDNSLGNSQKKLKLPK